LALLRLRQGRPHGGESTWLQIVLSEAKNREIRRMLAQLASRTSTPAAGRDSSGRTWTGTNKGAAGAASASTAGEFPPPPVEGMLEEVVALAEDPNAQAAALLLLHQSPPTAFLGEIAFHESGHDRCPPRRGGYRTSPCKMRLAGRLPRSR
jgi:hypothetical protein